MGRKGDGAHGRKGERRCYSAPLLAPSPFRPVAHSPCRFYSLPSAANFSRIAVIKKLSALRTRCA